MGFRGSQSGKGKERAPLCEGDRWRQNRNRPAFPETGKGGESFPTNLRPGSPEALQAPAFPLANSSIAWQAVPPHPAGQAPALTCGSRTGQRAEPGPLCVSSLCLAVEMSLPSSTQLPAHPFGAQSPPWRREVGVEAGLNGAWEPLPETRPGQLSLGRWIRVCIEVVRAQLG